MPTLIRLFVFLVVLAGLGFAGMIALVTMVDPGEKDVTIKIPARDLVASPDAGPIDLNNLPAPVNVVPRDSSSSASEPVIDTSDPDASAPGVKTVDVGAPE